MIHICSIKLCVSCDAPIRSPAPHWHSLHKAAFWRALGFGSLGDTVESRVGVVEEQLRLLPLRGHGAILFDELHAFAKRA